MNIAKALKAKNQLAGEIGKLAGLISAENVQLNDNASRFNVAEMYAQYKTKAAELVVLKSAIAVANAGVWNKVFTIVELKGRIAFLRSMNTREGSHRERDYTQTIENKYTAAMNAKMVADEVEQFEKQIVELQDEVDDYNHSTTI